MKFKNYIETESGIKDTSTSPGTAGQVLSSTVTGTSWIDPDTLEAAAAKLVVIACKNVSGVQILKGTPVYQSGTVGATDVIEVEPADATISTGYLPAIGILQTTLNNNGLGNVVITGEFLNYSTSGIPTNNPGGVPITGDTVYLAAGGGLTCIKPTGPGNAIQNLGLIGKVSGGNAGSITVSSIMRANDVPNLPEGRIWIGDGNTIVSDTVYVDEPNGRVGIGTTSPSEKLHVAGNTYIQNNLNIQSAISSAPSYGYPNVGAGQLIVGGNDFSPIFSPGVITLINQDTTINAGQDLGVLQFVGKDDFTSGYCSSQIIGTVFQAPGSGNSGGGILRFLTNPGGTGAGNTEKMRILPSGNVGIGTTVPLSKLHVVASVSGPIEYTNRCAILGLNDSTDTVYANSIGVAGRVKTSDGRAIYGEAQGGGWGGYFDGKGFFSNNVGIGTTNPQSQIGSTKILDISSNGNGEVILDHTDAGATSDIGLYSWNRNNDHLAHIKATCDGATDAAFISFHTQATGGSFLNPSSNEKMRIESSGNVGIGTTNPGTYKLAVAGSTAIGENLEVSDGLGGDKTLSIDATIGAFQIGDIDGIGDEAHIEGDSSNIKIFNGGSLTLITDINQNVGIGTASLTSISSTSSTLSLGSTSATTSGGIAFQVSGGVVKAYNYVASNYLINQTVSGIGQIFYGAGSERMRIHNTTGNVGIGTTSPSQKLHVVGGGYFQNGSVFVGTTSNVMFNYISSFVITAGSGQTIALGGGPGNINNNVLIGNGNLKVSGSVQLANDTAAASASKVGTFKYYTSGNNSYVDMCMQTGASTYAWVNIVTNSW